MEISVLNTSIFKPPSACSADVSKATAAGVSGAEIPQSFGWRSANVLPHFI